MLKTSSRGVNEALGGGVIAGISLSLAVAIFGKPPFIRMTISAAVVQYFLPPEIT